MTASKTRDVINKVNKNPEKFGTTAKRIKEVDNWIAEADGKKKKRGSK